MVRDDAIACQNFNGTLSWKASIGAHSSGFTITPSANANSDIVYYLALELADPDDAYVAIKDTITGTGDQAYTGAGFTPTALILGQTMCTAVNTNTTQGYFGIGAGGPASVEQSLGIIDENAQAASDSESYADLSNIVNIRSEVGSVDTIASLSSLDADGWTLNYSNGSGTARKMLAIAIGTAFGGTSAALAGAPAAEATATGALTTQIPLAGAAAVVATATGAISTAIPLAGQAAAVSVAGGVLTTTITLAGSALAQATAAGALAGGAAALSGDAAAVAAAVGGLTTQISLSGAALAQALASAELAGGAASLSGTATAQAQATGALLTQIPLAGAATAYATGAGNLSTLIPLTGAAASISSASGALTVEVGLTGGALAQALAAGSLTTIIRLDGAAIAQAAASGALGTGSGTLPIIPAHTLAAGPRVVSIAARRRTYYVCA